MIHDRDIIIADTPEEFAAGIIRVARDSRFADELACNLQRLVLEHYSIDSLAAQGKEILDFLAQK